MPGIPLGDFIYPYAAYPIVRDQDFYGGFQVCADIAARNAIPALNRKEGMLVYVVSDDTYYRLLAGLVLWVPASMGGTVYTFTAGENIAEFEVVYGDAAGGAGRIKKALNTSEAASRVIGVATETITTGNPIRIQVGGQHEMHFAADPTVANFGKPVYLDATAGRVTLTAPTAAGSVVIRVGWVAGYGAADALVNIAIGDQFQL